MRHKGGHNIQQKESRSETRRERQGLQKATAASSIGKQKGK